MEKVSVAPFKVIGIAIRTTNQNNQAAEDIAALWNRFIGENSSAAIPHKLSNDVYAVYTGYESDHTGPYTTLIGCRVSDLTQIPEGMVGKSFEGGNYASITATGDLTKGLIVDQWKQIWEMDLQRRFTADFERFGEKAQNPANAAVDFFVAVD